MRAAWSELGAIDPKALVEARLQAHHAVQWVTRAARANPPATPDDSHSNLGWVPRLHGLVSHDLIASDGSMYRCGLRVDAMTLFVAKHSEMTSEFELDGQVDADAASWIDDILTDLGLNGTGGVALPYDIPAHPVATGGRYSCASDRSAFAALARWFEAADDILEEVRSRLAGIGSGPGAVRCWPHHFDIATLLSLGGGDPEKAAAIGIGMSPGDAYYPQPYFYISPWGASGRGVAAPLCPRALAHPGLRSGGGDRRGAALHTGATRRHRSVYRRSHRHRAPAACRMKNLRRVLQPDRPVPFGTGRVRSIPEVDYW